MRAKSSAKSSTEIVYNKIKQKILTCEYKPGQLISEKEIVEEFETSRTPVREALSSLSGQGLIDIIPKKGVQISQLSIKKVKEVYELRKILEPLSIKYAIRYIKAEDIDNLNKLDKILIDSMDNEDILTLFKAGMDYHLYIARLTHNETLFEHLRILREESYRSLAYYLINYINGCRAEEKKKVLYMVGGSHSELTQALKENNEQAAIDALLLDLDGMSKVISMFS